MVLRWDQYEHIDLTGGNGVGEYGHSPSGAMEKRAIRGRANVIQARETQWTALTISVPIIVGVGLSIVFLVVGFIIWRRLRPTYTYPTPSPDSWHRQNSASRTSVLDEGKRSCLRFFYGARRVKRKRTMDRAHFSIDGDEGSPEEGQHSDYAGADGGSRPSSARSQHVRLTSADLPLLDTTSSKSGSNSNNNTFTLLQKSRLVRNVMAVFPWQPIEVRSSKRRGGFEVDGVNASTPVASRAPNGTRRHHRRASSAEEEDEDDVEAQAGAAAHASEDHEERASLIPPGTAPADGVVLISREPGRNFSIQTKSTANPYGHDPSRRLDTGSHASLSAAPQTPSTEREQYHATPAQIPPPPLPSSHRRTSSSEEPNLKRHSAGRRKSSDLPITPTTPPSTGVSPSSPSSSPQRPSPHHPPSAYPISSKITPPSYSHGRSNHDLRNHQGHQRTRLPSLTTTEITVESSVPSSIDPALLPAYTLNSSPNSAGGGTNIGSNANLRTSGGARRSNTMATTATSANSEHGTFYSTMTNGYGGGQSVESAMVSPDFEFARNAMVPVPSLPSPLSGGGAAHGGGAGAGFAGLR